MLGLALAAALALIALAAVARDPLRRGYGVLFCALLALYLGVRALPLPLPGLDEDWLGPLLAAAAVGGVCWAAVRAGHLTRDELGLTLRQAPGTRRALGWTGLLLVLNAAWTSTSDFRLSDVPAETWLFQATVPGLTEEFVFRAVLLAVADRMFASRFTAFGARLGWGAVLVTGVFFALHGPTLGTALGVLPPALLYLWLRARTGSLLWPVLVHNLWNLSVFAAHV